jgi:proteasome assembly chaperone (PAC2) family protein
MIIAVIQILTKIDDIESNIDDIETKTDDLGSLISHILDMFQQAL